LVESEVRSENADELVVEEGFGDATVRDERREEIAEEVEPM
jgi:hypothetical protein